MNDKPKRLGRLADPDFEPTDEEMDAVLRGALRGALRQRLRALGGVIGGHPALMESGSSSQVTRHEYVLIPDLVDGASLQSVRAALAGVQFHRRPAVWFEQL